MQLEDGTEELLDPAGIKYAKFDAFHEDALLATRDLLSADLRLLLTPLC